MSFNQEQRASVRQTASQQSPYSPRITQHRLFDSKLPRTQLQRHLGVSFNAASISCDLSCQVELAAQPNSLHDDAMPKSRRISCVSPIQRETLQVPNRACALEVPERRGSYLAVSVFGGHSQERLRVQTDNHVAEKTAHLVWVSVRRYTYIVNTNRGLRERWLLHR